MPRNIEPDLARTLTPGSPRRERDFCRRRQRRRKRPRDRDFSAETKKWLGEIARKGGKSGFPTRSLGGVGFRRLNGGVRSQMRTRLHPHFPANRENNREFRIFEGSRDNFPRQKALRCSPFSTNSLPELTGKISVIAGNSIRITGNSSPAQ
jgi:hypothetical protein